MEVILFLFGVVFGAALCGVTMWVWPGKDKEVQNAECKMQNEVAADTSNALAFDTQWENLLRYDGTNQFTGGEEPDDESGENGL